MAITHTFQCHPAIFVLYNSIRWHHMTNPLQCFISRTHACKFEFEHLNSHPSNIFYYNLASTYPMEWQAVKTEDVLWAIAQSQSLLQTAVTGESRCVEESTCASADGQGLPNIVFLLQGGSEERAPTPGCPPRTHSPHLSGLRGIGGEGTPPGLRHPMREPRPGFVF